MTPFRLPLTDGEAAERGFIRSSHGPWIRIAYANHDEAVLNEVLTSDCYWTSCFGRWRDGSQVIVDVGAHIGSFAWLWHQRDPTARIVCVEACLDNIEILTANVGEFAQVVHAACTYEPGELALLNSVKPGGTATGGSTVIPATEFQGVGTYGHLYWRDSRPLPKFTLEDAMQLAGDDRIDLLKVDCEGGEFSILEHGPLDRVAMVVGEYHGRARWDQFRARRLPNWDYGHMHSSGELGIFHYRNPQLPAIP